MAGYLLRNWWKFFLKDRLLWNADENPQYKSGEGYTRKTEDIAFLEDQRGV